jgi:3-hydroxybutyryl-CoA dehydratase
MMTKGDKFAYRFEVTADCQENFMVLFKDRNILHVDDVYAKSKGFKRKVMQGNILNGYLSYFVGEMLPVKNVIIHSQEIKFAKPVYQDDILDFEAEVKGVYDSVDVVEFTYSFRSLSHMVAFGKVQIGIL